MVQREVGSLKILFLGDTRSPHVTKWVDWFAQDHECHVASFHPNPVVTNGARAMGDVAWFHPLKGSGKKRWLLGHRQIKRLITEIKPDIVNSHYLATYGYAAAKTGFHPHIATLMASEILLDWPWHIRHMVRVCLDKADIVTCDGYNTAAKLRAMGVPPDRVAMIRLGVDAERFRDIDESDLMGTMLYTLVPIKTWNVMTARYLRPVYGIDTLIRAINDLKTIYGMDVSCYIAGDGDQRDQLETMSEGLPIKFGGQLSKKTMPYAYNAAQIYVSPSRSDGGISVSTLEAMACGLPIVATDVADNSYWIKDGWNGYIVPVDSPLAMARQIKELLENPLLRERMGKRNRRIVKKNQDYDNWMGRAEEVFEATAQKFEGWNIVYTQSKEDWEKSLVKRSYGWSDKDG